MDRKTLINQYHTMSRQDKPIINIDVSKTYIVKDGFMPVCIPQTMKEENNTISLSIHPDSVRDIIFNEEHISFKASFDGFVCCLQVPYEAVMDIISQHKDI